MSDAKHTPGPWIAVKNGFQKCAVKANGIWITYSAGDDLYIKRQEIEANANLIAAAPDLYEALAAIEGKINDLHVKDMITTDEHGMILAALSKARGESNG